jgi:hypothetical protein
MLPAVSLLRTAVRDAARPSPADDPAVRAVAAIGLICVGIMHALEIRGQLHGAAWLTAGFATLTITAPAGGLWLLARPAPLAWTCGGLICLAAAAGYILTRSVPVPGDASDVGNWLEPLGLASLISESIIAILAAMTLASRSSRHQTSKPHTGQPRLGAHTSSSSA